MKQLLCNNAKNMAKTIAALFLLTLGAASAHAQLLHSYTFDSAATDSVGTANGTLFNGASVSGGSLNMDGINDYVQFSQKIVPTSGTYTVALFARQNVSQAGSYVEMISQGFSGGPGFYMGFNTVNNIRLTDSWGSAYAAPAAGRWHHYALTVGGGTSNFYLDGILRATLGSQITTTLSGTDTRFGNQFAGYSEYFNGSLDDVNIYGTALSSTQVAALAAAGPSIVPEAGTAVLLLPVLALVGIEVIRRRK